MSQQTPSDPSTRWVPPGPIQPPTSTLPTHAAPIQAAPTQAIPAGQTQALPTPPNPYGGPSQPPPPPDHFSIANPWASPEQWPNPYATNGGRQPAPGPFPVDYARPGPKTNVSAIILLVLSIVALLPTGLLATPSTILAIVALSQNRESPTSSRRLTWMGWAVFVVAILLAGLAWAWVFGQLSGLDPTSDPYSY